MQIVEYMSPVPGPPGPLRWQGRGALAWSGEALGHRTLVIGLGGGPACRAGAPHLRGFNARRHRTVPMIALASVAAFASDLLALKAEAIHCGESL